MGLPKVEGLAKRMAQQWALAVATGMPTEAVQRQAVQPWLQVAARVVQLQEWVESHVS